MKRSIGKESIIKRPGTVSSSPEYLNAYNIAESMPSRRYRVYGLTVETELEFPELLSTRDEIPDVRVCFGSVPETVENAIVKTNWCQASKREFLMQIEGVARFHVADGRRIAVELSAGSENKIRASDVRLWLLGSAFGALLHQRGMLPLHVSAIKGPNGVWAFTGPSGEGKSTLAGFLHRRFGWKLVSDDVSVIDSDRCQAIVHPGPQKLKLWADALEHLDFPGCTRVRDLSNTDKFQLYLPGDSGYKPEPLRGLVLLESASTEAESNLERLKGSEAFSACMASIYRPYMDAWFKLPERRMGELVQLCQQVKIYRFRRPRSLESMEQHLAPLLELIVNGES